MNPPQITAYFIGLACCLAVPASRGSDATPAPQHFRQEVAERLSGKNGLPTGAAQLVLAGPNGRIRAFIGGQWYEQNGEAWPERRRPGNPPSDFSYEEAFGQWRQVPVPAKEVKQLLQLGSNSFVATQKKLFRVDASGVVQLSWPENREIHQIAHVNGVLHVASSNGLFASRGDSWERIAAIDDSGRDWAAREVLGVGVDFEGRLWMATKAGAGRRTGDSWRFYEGKGGLPWNDFTGIATGQNGEMWFATHLGVIRFDGKDWNYREGPLWLPSDDVTQMCLDNEGTAWFATPAGVGRLERRPMSLAQKAAIYEDQIERYVKRTPLGYVAEAPLRQPADLSSAAPQDSDNDGLWTAMYGAGECFAYAATHAPEAKARAKQAFEALRFLQKVTQGCDHAPPKGYVARTIRPIDWPDPNAGRLQGDLEEQKHDKLWKAYEPRWPKSADGKWYWKSDTSSDELDGHFFFYPLYYDFCADSPAEKDRVREVVGDLTDHLMAHDFCLIDHDGKPTRWGVYGPDYLNNDPNWWAERGLKSLSMLCYLAVAAHVTGEAKYEQASRQLIDKHGYAHNAMHPKVQHGPGSGNQSDDEMAFMCYYGLLNCSRDEQLKELIRYSFFRYWVNEEPEMNPFFNFAYAGQNREKEVAGVWGSISVKPWTG